MGRLEAAGQLQSPEDPSAWSPSAAACPSVLGRDLRAPCFLAPQPLPVLGHSVLSLALSLRASYPTDAVGFFSLEISNKTQSPHLVLLVRAPVCRLASSSPGLPGGEPRPPVDGTPGISGTCWQQVLPSGNASAPTSHHCLSLRTGPPAEATTVSGPSCQRWLQCPSEKGTPSTPPGSAVTSQR